jgi:adenine-specific DNA-methyltransferase
MKLKPLSLKQSLNDAYRLMKPERTDIEKFKSNLKLLLSHINLKESEENMKGHVMDFLKNTYYNPDYHIAPKGRTDFVIHTGKVASHPSGVLVEVKKPSNPEITEDSTN